MTIYVRWFLVVGGLVALGCGSSGSEIVPGPDAGGEVACVQEDCSCTGEDDCLAHATCVGLGTDSASCECVTGYDLDSTFCVWQGVGDPDVNGDPSVWELSGDLVIDGTFSEEGMADDGIALWSVEGVSAYDTMVQTMTMPTREESEPFVAVLKYRTVGSALFFAPGLILELGPHAHRLPPTALNAWQTSRVCLGDLAYGGELPIRLSSSVPNEYPGFTNFTHTIELDYMNIEPAVRGECPESGAIFGGDFESDLAWVGEARATSKAEVRPDVGLANSAAGVLETTSCTDLASLETRISIPADGAGKAIEFTWKAAALSVGHVALGRNEHSFLSFIVYGVAGRSISSVTGPEANFQTSRACIPPEFLGTSTTLTFSLQRDYTDPVCDETNRQLIFDDVSLIDAPACPTAGAVLDPDFEAVQSALLPGWGLNRQTDRAAEIVASATAASGSNVLRLASTPVGTTCRFIEAFSAFRLPDVGIDERPAVRFKYRFNLDAADASYVTVLRNLERIFLTAPRFTAALDGEDRRGDAWFTATVCADVRDAGRPLQLTFQLTPLDCLNNLNEQVAEVDDVEVLAVPLGECAVP